MKSVVIIQARTNSSRLPAKVLLPISGFPIVVLAALRAGNTGRHIIVATSAEDSDDYLADVLHSYGIECFRGSLENTLSRFVDALQDFPDNTIVFRLTADNVIPDGKLLDEIEQDFLHRNLDHISCNGPQSGLPYGMSAEATRLVHLREALHDNPTAYDREHVTPAIIRKFGHKYFEKHIKKNMGAYRCTIDCLDDFLSMAEVFSENLDPIKIDAFTLVEELVGKKNQPFHQKQKTIHKFVLGTAQLGINYGINNKTGKPSVKASEEIIKSAIANGVKFLDTARAYGESEAIIGRIMSSGWQGRTQIATKLETLLDLPSDAPKTICDAFVDRSILNSLLNLQIKKIDALLLHRTEHLHAWNGKIWERLLEHQRAGRINTLGVSVQSEDELLQALEIPGVQHIQMPFNILDWRWESTIDKINFTRNIRPLTIHVRSIYLQGLLISEDSAHWEKAQIKDHASIKDWLLKLTKYLNRSSIQDLCLAYVNGFEWVDGIVIGLEEIDQLRNNIELITKNPLTQSEIQEIHHNRPKLPVKSLNPAMWSK